MAAVAVSRRLASNRRVTGLGLAVALLAFSVGLGLAWKSTDVEVLSVLPIGVIIILTPASIGAAAWQLRTLTKMTGAVRDWRTVLRVTALGNLSSLLPVSSGTVVRAGAIVFWGSSVGAASRVLVIDAGIWLLVTLSASGGAALWLGHGLVGGVLLGAALVGFGLSRAAARRSGSETVSIELTVARVVGLCAEIGRLSAAFAALGHPIPIAQTIVLVAPNVLASLLFFLPGGLGVREGMTAGLAELVNVDAGAAFLAVALDRVVVLTALLFWEFAVWLIAAARSVVAP